MLGNHTAIKAKVKYETCCWHLNQGQLTDSMEPNPIETAKAAQLLEKFPEFHNT
jgi:hypothetical protein